MAARGSAGTGRTKLPGKRHTPGRSDFAAAGEHLPALRAGLLVRGERETVHEGSKPAGTVCRRLCPWLPEAGGRTESLRSALPAIRDIRIEAARGENPAGTFR